MHLELVLDDVAEQAVIKVVKVIIKYFRQVDNVMYLMKTKEMLVKVGLEINNLMNQHNLQLQIPYSTNKESHYNFSLE